MNWSRDRTPTLLALALMLLSVCGCRGDRPGRVCEGSANDAQPRAAASSRPLSIGRPPVSGAVDVSRAAPRGDALSIGSERKERPSSPLPDSELRKLAVDSPKSLGSLSLGQPHQGALVNPVQLADGPNWIVAYPDNAWATTETIHFLERAFGTATLQGGPIAYVGDLSAPWGGPLSPHKSHQSGRDVDIGYYRLDERWWADASDETLDTVRTWALLRALITTTDVEVIFVDRALQVLLRTYALSIGTNPAWLDRLFDLGRPGRRSVIRHAPEHLNHLHVRFYNPQAQRIGRVVHDLVAHGVERAPPAVVPLRCLPSSCIGSGANTDDSGRSTRSQLATGGTH
jgi:murein endopeptidase